MKMKYVGENPNCQAIHDISNGFVGDYHPSCCRWPKSCSSGMYEFYPEDEIEIPKKVRVCRLKGVGPGTEFDWIVYGYHPTAHTTITLFVYFATMSEAHIFVDALKNDPSKALLYAGNVL